MRVNTVKRASYSLLAAGLVFMWLALPTLSRMFGPIVYIPVYALVALTAGALVWSVLGWIARSIDEQSRLKESDVDSLDAAHDTAESPEVDVDRELESLKDDS